MSSTEKNERLRTHRLPSRVEDVVARSYALRQVRGEPSNPWGIGLILRRRSPTQPTEGCAKGGGREDLFVPGLRRKTFVPRVATPPCAEGQKTYTYILRMVENIGRWSCLAELLRCRGPKKGVAFFEREGSFSFLSQHKTIQQMCENTFERALEPHLPYMPHGPCPPSRSLSHLQTKSKYLACNICTMSPLNVCLHASRFTLFPSLYTR